MPESASAPHPRPKTLPASSSLRSLSEISQKGFYPIHWATRLGWRSWESEERGHGHIQATPQSPGPGWEGCVGTKACTKRALPDDTEARPFSGRGRVARRKPPNRGALLNPGKAQGCLSVCLPLSAEEGDREELRILCLPSPTPPRGLEESDGSSCRENLDKKAKVGVSFYIVQ